MVSLGNRRPVSALCLGAMNFGTSTPAETAFAILDRFVEAGGTFIDTSNNYNQWVGHGGESEELLGQWMRSRGNRDSLVIATKCGARTTVPGDPGDAHWEGLSASAVSSAVKGSLSRLGVDRIDLYYAHIDDRSTPLDETVAAFGRLAAEGVVDLVGCSNTATWRLDRARQTAVAQGVAPYSVIQQHSSYLWPNPPALQGVLRRGTPHFQHAGIEHFDYLSENPDLTLVAYQPLLGGSYVRPDRPFWPQRGYAHPTAYVRFEALRQIAGDLGASPNQVVLAWLIHHGVVPLIGVSSIPQLEEALAAVDLQLDANLMTQLDNA
ncbi:aryl-alcohol dehydrogenase-like predicted oxidoreductase [Kribbella sp. VKM Ac-2571]|uniref:aldo/keto reductase n=1 Tax=Kribbella sp. VKM Ac-2571 TaxID=2512222 RepID=UPI001060F636|nr:aldo/keto reductase [Kribbella sp. VKM Ac-2571]TDO55523.1 aryl-alcohol dehydrogenase-like predicted oxidoreductase [Kribbella sp. VKM Ac-2571]